MDLGTTLQRLRRKYRVDLGLMSFETDISLERLQDLERGVAKDPPTSHELIEIREAFPSLTELELIELETAAVNFERQPSLL